MYRPSLFTFSCVFLALVVILTGVAGAAAQDTDPADHPIVGTWQVFLGDDPHVHGLVTHHADGTLTSSDPVTTPLAPGAYVSAAYGVWEATGPNTIAYTYQGFNSDADGNVVGIVTVSGIREVSADGQTFGGNGVFQLADADGNVIFTAPADDVRGARMTVESMDSLATPAASPESGADAGENPPLSINGVVDEIP